MGSGAGEHSGHHQLPISPVGVTSVARNGDECQDLFSKYPRVYEQLAKTDWPTGTRFPFFQRLTSSVIEA